jgi:hypothetical protein
VAAEESISMLWRPAGGGDIPHPVGEAVSCRLRGLVSGEGVGGVGAQAAEPIAVEELCGEDRSRGSRGCSRGLTSLDTCASEPITVGSAERSPGVEGVVERDLGEAVSPVERLGGTIAA